MATDEPDDRVYFFVHVMKTAGGTFRNHLLANFGADRCYPDWTVDQGMANVHLKELDAVSDERMAAMRAFSGHFPYLATDRVEARLGRPVTRLTILRHPVDRTISLLGDMRHWNDDTKDRSVEDLYGDPLLNAMFMKNHMSKVFALTEQDAPPSYLHGLEVDDTRYDLACERLARCDLVGMREGYSGFLDEIRRRWGWAIDEVPDRHLARGDEFEVSQAFRDRIAEDNPRDMAFHEFALRLIAERERG